jgi:hypothetical protein
MTLAIDVAGDERGSLPEPCGVSHRAGARTGSCLSCAPYPPNSARRLPQPIEACHVVPTACAAEVAHDQRSGLTQECASVCGLFSRLRVQRARGRERRRSSAAGRRIAGLRRRFRSRRAARGCQRRRRHRRERQHGCSRGRELPAHLFPRVYLCGVVQRPSLQQRLLSMSGGHHRHHHLRHRRVRRGRSRLRRRGSRVLRSRALRWPKLLPRRAALLRRHLRGSLRRRRRRLLHGAVHGRGAVPQRRPGLQHDHQRAGLSGPPGG